MHAAWPELGFADPDQHQVWGCGPPTLPCQCVHRDAGGGDVPEVALRRT